jgi:hypothetical protein
MAKVTEFGIIRDISNGITLTSVNFYFAGIFLGRTFWHTYDNLAR